MLSQDEITVSDPIYSSRSYVIVEVRYKIIAWKWTLGNISSEKVIFIAGQYYTLIGCYYRIGQQPLLKWNMFRYADY